MNKQRLKAYLDLIQGLLSCPQGEEWILLRQNEQLVNLELVGVMEQVANHLAMEGNIKPAKYLHNWAAQLHHILTESVATPESNQEKTEAYVQLIQALLNCPEGSEAEILAAHQELIGPELVKVMQQVANQMAAEGDEDTARFLSNLATDLNRTWLKNHEFKPTLKKEIAPDPWLEENSSSPPTSSVRETKSTPLETASNPQESVSPLPKTDLEQEPQLSQQLQAIADSLTQLEATIAARMQPVNPLWYMDVLEKAEAAHWILTTEEVEKLIGIKPHCHHDETSYQRGNWIFIKAGKIGAQTGWQVKKQTDSIN